MLALPAQSPDGSSVAAPPSPAGALHSGMHTASAARAADDAARRNETEMVPSIAVSCNGDRSHRTSSAATQLEHAPAGAHARAAGPVSGRSPEEPEEAANTRRAARATSGARGG